MAVKCPGDVQARKHRVYGKGGFLGFIRVALWGLDVSFLKHNPGAATATRIHHFRTSRGNVVVRKLWGSVDCDVRRAASRAGGDSHGDRCPQTGRIHGRGEKSCEAHCQRSLNNSQSSRWHSLHRSTRGSNCKPHSWCHRIPGWNNRYGTGFLALRHHIHPVRSYLSSPRRPRG